MPINTNTLSLSLCIPSPPLSQIIFHDEAKCPPVWLSHYLKLYEEGQSAQTAAAALSTKPVVRETYDELILWEPTEAYYRRVNGMCCTVYLCV